MFPSLSEISARETVKRASGLSERHFRVEERGGDLARTLLNWGERNVLLRMTTGRFS